MASRARLPGHEVRENILHFMVQLVGMTVKTLGTPRPVAHDELTDVAMHCVRSFIGPKACVTGLHRPWDTSEAQALAAPLSQWLEHCLSSSPELGNWAAFAHFFGPKVSGDEAVTNGDKLGGMEFACFSELKTESKAQRAFGQT